jgi:diadenosine tetraphosphate (Ap4A) HIT family hydrolase
VSGCLFCPLDLAHIWIENEHAIAFAPADPIADGHMVIAPHKHVATVYALTANEQAAVRPASGGCQQRTRRTGASSRCRRHRKSRSSS